MAFTAKCSKKVAGVKTACPKAAAGAGAAGANIQDNQDSTITTLGVTASGADVDISSVATEVITSSDPTIASVGTAVGMTAPFSGLKAGTCTFTIVATWTDGSVAPQTLVVTVTVSAKPDPVTGLAVTFGPVTVRP
jgi:hypothetical protein